MTPDGDVDVSVCVLDAIKNASSCVINSVKRFVSLAAIGVAKGCSGCTCTPQGGEIFFRPNLQENV